MAMLINATSYVTDTATQARLDPPAATLLIAEVAIGLSDLSLSVLNHPLCVTSVSRSSRGASGL